MDRQLAVTIARLRARQELHLRLAERRKLQASFAKYKLRLADEVMLHREVARLLGEAIVDLEEWGKA
jgi:hypothetical protein